MHLFRRERVQGLKKSGFWVTSHSVAIVFASLAGQGRLLYGLDQILFFLATLILNIHFRETFFQAAQTRSCRRYIYVRQSAAVFEALRASSVTKDWISWSSVCIMAITSHISKILVKYSMSSIILAQT